MSAWRYTGVWVAVAAVVATTGSAHTPDAGGVARAAYASAVASSAAKPPVHQRGEVAAAVPMASFGPADGAPQMLVAGRTYQMVITVWVAATSGPAVVEIVTSDGRLLGTTHASVRAGVTRLHFSLVAGVSTHVTIALTAHTRDGGTVTRAYSHQT